MSHVIAGILCSTVMLMPADLGLPDPFGLRGLDMRTDFPPPKPFGKDIEALPGNTPTSKTLSKTWVYRMTQNDVTMETGREPRLFASIELSFRSENEYELRYVAIWGPTRNYNDPRFGGVKVQEKGRFSISGDIVILEPRMTKHTQRIKGERRQETIRNQNHTYIAHVDRAYLNLVGPCAGYQVEPICKETRSVWFSLRQTDSESAGEEPDF